MKNMRVRDVLKRGAIYYASFFAYIGIWQTSIPAYMGWFAMPFLILGVLVYGIPALFVVPPLMAAKIISIRQQRMMGFRS